MNYLDILILLILVFGAWRGFKKGMVIEFFTLLALFVGIYAGTHFSGSMSRILQNEAGVTSEYLPAISFTLTMLLVGALVYFIGKMLEKAVKTVALGPVNKLAGLFFGIAKMLLICSVLLLLLDGYDRKGEFIPKETMDDSLLYTTIKETTVSTIPVLRHSDLLFDRPVSAMHSGQIGRHKNLRG